MHIFALTLIYQYAENHLVFRDLWKEKTTVKYNDKTAPRRQGFVWVLFRNRPDIEISMKDGFEFNFKIKWPDRSEQQNVEYEIHLKQYLQEHRNVMPILTQLLAKQDSCRQPPIYLLNEELGRGSFGTVYKSVNVSTALVCAVKKFRDPEGHMKEVEILKELSHVSRSMLYSYWTLWVMPYFPLGDLHDQHQKSHITVERCTPASQARIQTFPISLDRRFRSARHGGLLPASPRPITRC